MTMRAVLAIRARRARAAFWRAAMPWLGMSIIAPAAVAAAAFIGFAIGQTALGIGH